MKGKHSLSLKSHPLKPSRTGQCSLLQEVVGTLGITINSISNHMKAERLLQESQSLTEELQVQSEESADAAGRIKDNE